MDSSFIETGKHMVWHSQAQREIGTSRVQFNENARASIQFWEFSVLLISLIEWICLMHSENLVIINANKENGEFLSIWKVLELFVWRSEGATVAVFQLFSEP